MQGRARLRKGENTVPENAERRIAQSSSNRVNFAGLNSNRLRLVKNTAARHVRQKVEQSGRLAQNRTKYASIAVLRLSQHGEIEITAPGRAPRRGGWSNEAALPHTALL